MNKLFTFILLGVCLFSPAVWASAELKKQIDAISEQVADRPRHTLERLLALKPSVLSDKSAKLRGHYLQHLSNAYLLSHQYEKAIQAAQRGLSAVRQQGAAPDELLTLLHISLGHAHQHLGQLRQAVSHYSAGVDFAEKLEVIPLWIRGNLGLGGVYLELQDLKQAKEKFEITLVKARELDLTLAQARIYRAFSFLHRLQGEVELAMQFMRRSREFYSRLDDARAVFNIDLSLAEDHLELGEAQQAADIYQRVLKADAVTPENQFRAWSGLLQSHQRSDESERAKQAIAKADALLTPEFSLSNRVQYLLSAADFLAQRKEIAAATARVSQAERALLEFPTEYAHQSQTLLAKSQLLYAAGEYEAAYQAQIQQQEAQIKADELKQQDLLDKWHAQFDNHRLEERILASERESQRLARQLALHQKKKNELVLINYVLLVALLLFFALVWSHRWRNKQRQKLQQLDELTGVRNRESGIEVLQQLLARANQQQQGCALALLKVSDLMKLNQSIGMFACDKILHQLAQRFVQVSGNKLNVCRYSAGTFMLILPGLSWNQQELIKDKVVKAMHPLKEQDLNLTLGMAFNQPGCSDASQLLAKAEASLEQGQDLFARGGMR